MFVSAPAVAAAAPVVTSPGNQASGVGSAVSLTIKATGGTAPLSWTATTLPAGLTINKTTGVISGSPSATGSYATKVTATDAAKLAGTVSFTWTTGTAPTVANPGDRASTVNTAVSVTSAATGGTKPYTWSATGLPTGLSINASTGAITGTPSQTGKFATTVTATAANKIAGKASYNWDVATALTVTNPGTQQATIGTSFSKTMTAGGGTSPYTWSATGLPAGLTINGSTGAISGTPTSATTTTTTAVTATDAAKRTGTVSFTFTTASAPTLTNPGPQTGTVGTTISKTLTVSGGTTPYTWSATGLPAGLAINASTGAITGKPTSAGETNVTVTVTDAAKRASSATFVWTIGSVPTVTSPGNQRTPVGQSTSLTLDRIGGTAPYRWSATGLPAGLTINTNTGAITGIPTTVGTSTTAVTVTDAASRTNTVSFSWVIALAVSNPGIQKGTKGTPLALSMTVAGGKAPYTWSATGLPAGLTINTSTGAITGTPTSTTAYTSKVTARDASGNTGDTTFSWQIATPITIASTNMFAVVGVNTHVALEASGGSGTYTWSVTGLPAGLRLDTTTGLITGTPDDIGQDDAWIPVTVTATDTAGRTSSLDNGVRVDRRIAIRTGTYGSDGDWFSISAYDVGSYSVQILDVTTGQVFAAQQTNGDWTARLPYKATGIHTFTARLATSDGTAIQATSLPDSFDFSHPAPYNPQWLKRDLGYNLEYPSSGAVDHVEIHAYALTYLTTSTLYLEIEDVTTGEILASCASGHQCDTTVTADRAAHHITVGYSTYTNGVRERKSSINVGPIDFGPWWVKAVPYVIGNSTGGRWEIHMVTNRSPGNDTYSPSYYRIAAFDATTSAKLTTGCKVVSPSGDLSQMNISPEYPYTDENGEEYYRPAWRPDAPPVFRCIGSLPSPGTLINYRPFDPTHPVQVTINYDTTFACTLQGPDCGTELVASAVTSLAGGIEWQNVDGATWRGGDRPLIPRSDINESEIPSADATPSSISLWWALLNGRQREYALQTYPQRVRHLDGLPAAVRDKANRQYLMDLRHSLTAEKATYIDNPARQDQVSAIDVKLNRIERTFAALTMLSDRGDTGFLLGIDLEDDGKIIIADQDPDKARHAAVWVPGFTTTIDSSLQTDPESNLYRIINLKDSADLITPAANDVSTIMWLGYDAPDLGSIGGTVSVALYHRAEEGAEPLTRFVDGLRLAHSSGAYHLTVSGHSYGSTVVGEAARSGNLRADDILVAGSPGMHVHNAWELMIDPKHVWAGAAWNDPVAVSGWGAIAWVHDISPHVESFGANRYVVDTSGHSDYWTPGSTSLKNQAKVIAGRYTDVSLEHGDAPPSIS
ncbi:putative Ig domain-containing protein [Actinoplanes sp. NPDC049118]|uniref:putative Ig domain-containing protein n=1 Tax=Actinoplanes sp. NPDC049118 TaxID=3155769 RepID=UPI0033DB967D